MNIEKNNVVLVHYTLTEGTVDGEKIETTVGQEPMGFIYGVGAMIPAFEQNLEGLKKGDVFSFGIKAGEAYGEYDQNAIMDLPREIFAIDGVESDVLHVGNVVPLTDKEGRHFDGVVVSVDETTVKMDFNHPMAGVDLWFKGAIDDVRQASEEELNHGHVHGAGGHSH